MGSGIYISHDGGTTSRRSTARACRSRRTARPTSRSRRRTAPDVRADPDGADGVKGLKSEAQGSLWRSDDAGAAWGNVSWDRRLIGRAGYYIRIRVSPDDPDHVLIANSTLWRRPMAARLPERRRRLRRLPRHLVGHRRPHAGPLHRHRRRRHGHLRVAEPAGNTSVSLPIGQMYRVTVDQRSPYWVYSDRQDDGSMRLPSDTAVRAGERALLRAGGSAGRRAGGAAAAWARRTRRRTRRARRRGGRAGAGKHAVAASRATPIPSRATTDFVWGTCYAAHVATYDELSGQRARSSPGCTRSTRDRSI